MEPEFEDDSQDVYRMRRGAAQKGNGMYRTYGGQAGFGMSNGGAGAGGRPPRAKKHHQEIVEEEDY